MSPIDGETISTSPGSRMKSSPSWTIAVPSRLKDVHFSAPRSMPITPQTVWSCTGVFCPGPQTKLTTEKRSRGSA